MASATNTIILLCLVTLAIAKPIIVTFGTNQGPIEPPTERAPRLVPRNFNHEPAPVSEETEDIPNPHVYRAAVPHQYRNKIYQQRVPSNLVLGTPLDQKYTPSIDKVDVLRKQARVGVDYLGQEYRPEYTGPHIFEKQEYEIIEERKNPLRYIKPQHYDQKLQEKQQDQPKLVPQIGIIYSSGVRYYVPQLAYDHHRQEEEQENSVYDNKDEKYLYRANGQ